MGERPTIRTYGRRKGHRLSPRKQRLIDEMLPGLRVNTDVPPPEPATGLFSHTASEVWLEVGFGAGEHLAWQAEKNPHVGLIGCEPYINGVAALLASVEERGLTNIRIWDSDARVILDWLHDTSIARVFVLHPDPWPKARHHKRRLVSPETLRALARVMIPGAELRVATDIGDYARSTLEAVQTTGLFSWMAECAADWRRRPSDWPATRYEKKARREGRASIYLTFVRV
ncbi:MAG: tRNA (guanosine(46)-N7)-methyltransferase TrmB [Hyphomicrobiaceae bacterium]|nr:tRNA (guanosine(46)-N7)-methyltransferase TrmB [Hyphomicrobiaceae bacterium]